MIIFSFMFIAALCRFIIIFVLTCCFAVSSSLGRQTKMSGLGLEGPGVGSASAISYDLM